MSAFQEAYTLVALFSFVFGIIFFFIDGMLLWSILFFVLTIVLVVTRIIWNTSGWADSIVRKLGDDRDG